MKKQKVEFKKLTNKIIRDLTDRKMIPNINFHKHEEYKKWLKLYNDLMKNGEEDYLEKVLGI